MEGGGRVERVERCSSRGIDVVVVFGGFESGDSALDDVHIVKWSDPAWSSDFVGCTGFAAGWFAEFVGSAAVFVYVSGFGFIIYIGAGDIFVLLPLMVLDEFVGCHWSYVE